MMDAKENYSNLSGANKAAIFMLSLGPENSADLLKRMEDEEISDLSNMMANLGTIDASVVEQLLIEFTDNLSSTGSLLGTYDSTERLLLSSMEKEKVDLIMEEIRGPEGRTMWDKLDNVSEEILANYLKNEYPQTVAVILSKITPDHAARVLSNLPDNFAMEVVLRLLRTDVVNKDILEGIERTLRSEFMNNPAQTDSHDNHEQIANIFNCLDRSTESRLMDALEERNKESADKVKTLMFTFEDMTRIDPSGIQLLLRRVEKERLTVALKAASEDIKDLFFDNMSERATRMMREDMEAMGPIRVNEVDEAQNYVINIAKTLSESGEIAIDSGAEDDELVF